MGEQSINTMERNKNDFKFIPPKYTLGYLIIVSGVIIFTSIVILSGKQSACQADGGKIIENKQWYRLFTSPFVVSSFLDLAYMILSIFWLLFTLTQYESKYSTIYTLYHFWKTNIGIALAISLFYLLMFELVGMKNFGMNMSGIYPYALHIYLKYCLEKPSEIVNHWFLLFPINRWMMGFTVFFFSCLVTPETQACLAVGLYNGFASFLILTKYLTGLNCLYSQGPTIACIFYYLQKILPNCIKTHYGFISILQFYKLKQREQRQRAKKQQQQDKELQQTTQYIVQ